MDLQQECLERNMNEKGEIDPIPLENETKKYGIVCSDNFYSSQSFMGSIRYGMIKIPP